MVCMFLVVAAFPALAEDAAPSAPAPAKKPVLLVVTVTKGYRHGSIETGERVTQEIADRSGAFTVEYARTDEDLKTKMSASALKNYQGIFFLSTTGTLPLPDKQAFLDYIKSGKGFIGCHSATDTFHGEGDTVDPYIQMIGGEFVGHVEASVSLINEDPTHPATHDVGSNWGVYDEIYGVKNFSRKDTHVLLSLDKVPGSDQPAYIPISWTRDYGTGRVFYTALGHENLVWESPKFQRHLLGGIKWAMRLENPVKP